MKRAKAREAIDKISKPEDGVSEGGERGIRVVGVRVKSVETYGRQDREKYTRGRRESMRESGGE
jgi:hypothetical protein